MTDSPKKKEADEFCRGMVLRMKETLTEAQTDTSVIRPLKPLPSRVTCWMDNTWWANPWTRAIDTSGQSACPRKKGQGRIDGKMNSERKYDWKGGVTDGRNKGGKDEWKKEG